MVLSLLVFGGMLCVGLSMLLRPERFYTRFESWKSNPPGKPSKAYLWNTRLSGLVPLFFGVLGMLMAVLDALGLINAY